MLLGFNPRLKRKERKEKETFVELQIQFQTVSAQDLRHNGDQRFSHT